jgi:hypothetical protein
VHDLHGEDARHDVIVSRKELRADWNEVKMANRWLLEAMFASEEVFDL